jgi:FkbM family methyltransferase
MNLSRFKKDFYNGKINKEEYINKMYEIHQILFEYSEFIKTTNITEIQIQDDLIITTFRDSGIKFICIQGDQRLAPFDTLNFNEYEKTELDIQLKLIKPNSIIIDIGANLGWYAMHVSKKYADCIIYAFEPIPNTYRYLTKNIALNNLLNIHPVPLGLSNEKSTLPFYFDPSLSVNASLENVSGSSKTELILCPITTLDLFCAENKLTEITFIKCDIEGAELLALQGAKDTIASFTPIIFCEMLRKWTNKFNYHPNEIIRFLKTLHYNCYSISNNKLQQLIEIDDQTVETNFIFLHDEKHKYEISEFVK